MKSFSRRSFLKTSAIAAASAALSARSWSQVVGSNTDLRVAVVGLNGRGKNHLSSLRTIPGVRIAAICDPDSAVLDRIVVDLAEEGILARTFVDVRELLAAPDIDALTIATPNHWHSLMAIWACEAGKDVYVEKPVSHNVWEGRQLVAAARKYGRIVQAGTQIRSGAGIIEAVDWVRSGNLGKITASRGFCYKRRESIGKTSAPSPIPPSLDYDLWSGPAPLVPPHRNSPKNGPAHYDWHWFYLYGNGDVGNQGIHQMDIARWFLGEPGLPRHTLSVGGRFGYEDDGETPNTQVIFHDYSAAPLIFEVRGLPSRAVDAAIALPPPSAEAPPLEPVPMDNYRGVSIGNVVECEGGTVVVPGYFSATAYDRTGKVIREFNGEDRHMQNFIDCIRSRRESDLYGPIEEGHISSALCHLGNISHQLGRLEHPEMLLEKLQGQPALAEAYQRMAGHLFLNDVDLQKTPATLGVTLKVDSQTERFTGADAAAANALLTRNYRAPYIVPQLA